MQSGKQILCAHQQHKQIKDFLIRVGSPFDLHMLVSVGGEIHSIILCGVNRLHSCSMSEEEFYAALWKYHNS